MSRRGAGREWVRGWRLERRRSIGGLLCGCVVVLGWVGLWKGFWGNCWEGEVLRKW